LDAACRKGRLYFSPQNGGQFKPYQAVENAPGLLGVDKILIDLPGIGHGVKNCVFGDFIEHDPPGVFPVQFENLCQVPGNGFAFAVLVSRQPEVFCFFRQLFQLGHYFSFLRRDFVLGFVIILFLDTEILFYQVADMAETGGYLEILSQEFLDGLGFCRRLDDD
jgi:hypothetical protein